MVKPRTYPVLSEELPPLTATYRILSHAYPFPVWLDGLSIYDNPMVNFKSLHFNIFVDYVLSIPLGFTKKQLTVWCLRRDGLSLAEIGRRLGITRQAVFNIIGDIDSNMEQTLKTVAAAAKIEPQHIDLTKGILLGYSYETNNRAIVTFSAKHGAQIWQYHTGKCGDCPMSSKCRNLILGEAEERGIELTKEEKRKMPTELAHIVFSRIIPGLEP